MTRRKRHAIEVVGAPLDSWDRLGRSLLALDPARFERVLALAQGYVSAYDAGTTEQELDTLIAVASGKAVQA